MSLHTDWDTPTAPPRRLPGPPRAARVRRASFATVGVGTIVAALGGDHSIASLGGFLAICVTLVGLAVAGTLGGRALRVTIFGTVAFAPWFLIHTSGWLLLPNAVAGAALIAVGLSIRNGGALADSAFGYRRRAASLAHGAAIAPQRARLGIQSIAGQSRSETIRGAAGPIVLGVGIATVVAAVLASGDALFASYLDLGDVVSGLVGRIVVTIAAMACVVLGAGAAANSSSRPALPAKIRSAPRSLAFVATPLVVVYVAYVVVQLSAVVLGAEYVNERTGLTYADYARSGFFQLVGVSIVTFFGLAVTRPVLRRSTAQQRRVLLALATVASLCTMVMVAAAIVKLNLYADVFGLTMLRLYTTVFAAWLGLAIAIAWWSLLHRSGEWLVPAVAVAALLGVFAMNLVGPERVVAEHNLTETITSDDFDIAYLLSLGDAAVPSIADHLLALSAADVSRVRREWCREQPSAGLLDWNLADRRARDEIALTC